MEPGLGIWSLPGGHVPPRQQIYHIHITNGKASKVQTFRAQTRAATPGL